MMQNILNPATVSSRVEKIIKIIFLSVFVLGLEGASRVGAVGFRLPNQDPEAIARGNAFAATADDPAAIYYNPAGITQLQGYNLSLGVYSISANTEYKSPSGATASTDAELQEVPQIYFVDAPTNQSLSFGLGIYAPYGLSLDWGNKAPFKTVAESGSLIYLCVNPVVGWRVTKTLSVGFGPTINYSQASFNRAIGLISGDQFKFTGHALDYGFNLGILWQPHPMWSFGINYRSATKLNYQGDISTTPSPPYPPKTPTGTSIDFPQFVVAGISFRPTTNWNYEVDVDWTEWAAVNAITFRDPALGNPSLPLNLRDSFMFETGLTRQLGSGYFASIGYIYSQNSSPDTDYSPLIPDADLSLGSVGFGHHGRTWDWAIAYHFAYYADHTVRNDVNVPADGTYHTFNNAFNISVGYKF
jgi:long-chain fatty acid transport protein